ncbi:MAG: TlpA family protein disulfide reductase [Opitutales bacterium]
MKFHFPRHVALLSALLFSLGLPGLNAGETPAAPATPTPAVSGPSVELRELVEKISAKLKAGHPTEADLAGELKAFDLLLAKYSDQKTDEVAMIGIMKARLYLEVFDDSEQGLALLKKVKADFPNTKIAAHVDAIIAHVEQKAANDARFAIGKDLPAINEKGLDGQPLSTAALQGKVVLVDFWATWCGPCVGELPNVLAAYQKFHGKGFEIIGVSLDKSKDTLTAFLKERGMTWGQYFDGLGWDNKVAQAFGINSIPATFLLGRDGKIVAKDLRGDDLDKKLTELLGQ